MVELASSYVGFIFGLFEFFWLRIIEADWYFVPVLAFGLLFSLFFIFFLSIWLLAAIWNIVVLMMSHAQRLTKIKFPFIGDWLEAGLSASDERIAKQTDYMQKHEENMALAYLKYKTAAKELTDEDSVILRKILRLDKAGSNILEALREFEQIPEEDKLFFEKQFETGALDKWMETNKQYGAYSR